MPVGTPPAGPGPEGSPGHFAHTEWAEAAIATLNAEKVAKAGDTMTGPLTLPADPSAALHAATKQYVDARLVTTLVPSFGQFGSTNTLLLTFNVTIPPGALVRVTVTGLGGTASGALNAIYRILNDGGSTLSAQHVVHASQALNQTQALVFIFSMPSGAISLYGQTSTGTVTPAHSTSRITVERLT